MAKDKRLVLLKQANKLYRQGKIDAAIKQYKQILEIKPDDLEVRRIAGDLLLKQNVVDEAVSQFEWIADYYLKEGFYAKAIAMYKRITRVDQSREKVYIKLAELYTKQGLIMEAKQIYLDLVEECKRNNNQKRALDIYKKILEFDRSNDKMRLLLADNYLKEGLIDEAVEEYLMVVDLYLSKEENDRSIELLLKVYNESNGNVRILNKLVFCYTNSSREREAIELLKGLGDKLKEYPELFKKLGEIYFNIQSMDEAEAIYLQVVEQNPEETEIVMKLGKVYLQRNNVDKAYEVFSPAIEKSMENGKFDEATALLRFIIASENGYIPALQKLASVFKLSGKQNNLIALYESMIPVYHSKGLVEEEKKILKELISISESPFTYQEQLAALDGAEISVTDHKEEELDNDEERETEFVSFNLRIVRESLEKGDKFKAEDILKKTRGAFPRNLEICKVLTDFYRDEKRNDEYLSEGKQLLELYLQKNMKEEYEVLLEQLAQIKPEDENLIELSSNEQTSIELDFDVDEINEQMYEIESNEVSESEDDGVMILSHEDSVENIELPSDPHESSKAKSFASAISELDFYISNNMLDGAQELADMLKQLYPGNSELIERIKKIESERKKNEIEVTSAEKAIESVDPSQESDKDMKIPAVDFDVVQNQQTESDFSALDTGFELNSVVDAQNKLMTEEPPQEVRIELDSAVGAVEEIEINFDPPPVEESNIEIELPGGPEEFELETFHMDKPESTEPKDTGDISEIEISFDSQDVDAGSLEPVMESTGFDIKPQEPEAPLTFGEISSRDSSSASFRKTHVDQTEIEITDPLNTVELQNPVPQEPDIPKDDDTGKFPEFTEPKTAPPLPVDSGEFVFEEPEFHEAPSIDEGEEEFTFEFDEPEIQSQPQSPQTVAPQSPVTDIPEEIVVDSEPQDATLEEEFPFEGNEEDDLLFNLEESVLGTQENLWYDYYETESNIRGELASIGHWMQELERQRTSTIEKNMMEIFDEFKKGVEEKIGQEDYDTRYNLGIAYKEMGLIEEAIHEFLIASRHPLKFFDSAGLLGICFRDKGMFDDAVNWFERALEASDRAAEEYRAVKYEMVLTLIQKEDYNSALSIAEDILKEDSSFRDINAMIMEIKNNL